MAFLDTCNELFDTNDLYALLGISKDASEKEIKKAYKKKSLKVHPDRVGDEEKELATKKFQTLCKVSKILLNSETRGLYDETGSVDDDDFCLDESKLNDWAEYWKSYFKCVTTEKVKSFYDSYRFSDQESTDLKHLFIECEGDMDKVFESQLCSLITDEDRFRKILDSAIEKKELPAFHAYINESAAKRKRRFRKWNKEAKEVEQDETQLKNSFSSLEQQIMMRHADRQKQQDSFFDDLAAKYCKPKKPRNASSSSKSKSKSTSSKSKSIR